MKKLFSLLLAVLMILPLSVFPVSSANYDYWTFYGGHFLSTTGEIWAPKYNAYEISDEGFIYWPYNEDGSIYVDHPNPDNPYYEDYLSYTYSTSALTSNCTLPLEDLTVTVSPQEFNFDMDENGRSNMISVLWTESYINNLAGSSTSNCYCTGLYQADRTAGGLRNIVRPGNKGLCITLSNTDPDNIGTMISTDVVITYYDGSYTDENGSNGYSWRFTGSSVMPLSLDGVADHYENIDLTYGLTVTIKADETLGYVVNINGKDYYGQYASYTPDGKEKIDLRSLCDISKGFVTVGAVSAYNKETPDHKCSYTVDFINGLRPFELWDAVPDNHIHSYKGKRTQYGCAVDTIDTYTCDCGDSFTEVTTPYGHSYAQNTVFPTCTEEGYTQKVCRRCDDTIIVSTTPAKGHNYKTVANTGVQVCSRCGDTLNPEIPPHEHSYEEAVTEPTCTEDGYTQKLCRSCGDTIIISTIPAKGHNYKTVADTGVQVCSRCGDTLNPEIPPHEHRYTESRTEPTCENEGRITHTCDCGYSYSTMIPATGHTEGEQIENEYGDIETYCLICSEHMYTETGFKPHVHFDDVKKGHWYYDSVCHVVSKGYMYGMDTRTFSPNTDLTREQFVTILANIAKVDKDAYRDEQLMSDVKPNHWFAGSVNWAVKEGYVAGIAEGVFGVGQPIQRAALARLLYLYAERNGKQIEEKADLSEYTDFEKVQDWMADGLGWAVKHGIITSIKDDSLTLAPTATATRAQCARMLYVYDSVPNKELPPEPEPEPEPDVPNPEPEPKPLEVDTEALKDQLIRMGNKNVLGDYCFKKPNTSIAYDEENDELYAHYGASATYDFVSDTVEILGAGNVRPLFEIYGDYELLLPYQETKGYAKMTADGITDAPEKYKNLCNNFYDDLIEMLRSLNVLK